MIGARWKCSNVWSRSILIVPLPFYVLVYEVNACIDSVDKVDLTSNWCSHQRRSFDYRHELAEQGHRRKGFGPPRIICGTKRFKPPPPVPMARRKHLFSFRTQKLSSSAAIILRKWESSTVPDYIKTIRKGGFYFWLTCLVPLSVSGKTTDYPMALRGFYETKAPRSLLRFVIVQ